MKLVKRQRKNGLYYFKLVTKSGMIMMKSEDFSSKAMLNHSFYMVRKLLSPEVELFHLKNKIC